MRGPPRVREAHALLPFYRRREVSRPQRAPRASILAFLAVVRDPVSALDNGLARTPPMGEPEWPCRCTCRATLTGSSHAAPTGPDPAPFPLIPAARVRLTCPAATTCCLTLVASVSGWCSWVSPRVYALPLAATTPCSTAPANSSATASASHHLMIMIRPAPACLRTRTAASSTRASSTRPPTP